MDQEITNDEKNLVEVKPINNGFLQWRKIKHRTIKEKWRQHLIHMGRNK